MAELESVLPSCSTVLVLYSGGLDGTFLLQWLSRRRVQRLIALTVDLGGDPLPSDIREICSSFGAEWLLIDKKEEFANQYVAPSIPAQACYLNGHPICASLSRPLMAKSAMEIARAENVDTILHSSNWTQNSLRRFNESFERLGFAGAYGSPFEMNAIPREEKLSSLQNVFCLRSNNALYSSDTNLWGREFESGDLDDPEDIQVPEAMFSWTRESVPATSREIAITFYRGLPEGVNGKHCSFVKLISELQLSVGSFGIGRYIGLEEIDNGRKVQEIREMPAAALLYDAYRRLESAIVPAECIREKLHMEQLWVREAIEGRWFGITKESAQAFIENVAEKVSGTIVYSLKSYRFTVRSLKCANARYLRCRENCKSQNSFSS